MGNASVQRGLFLTFRLFSLIRHALRRATFPVGEGDLRRGLHSSGHGFHFQGSPPHPALRGHPLQAGEGRGFSPRRAQSVGGGITVYLLCCLSGISPGDSSTGCYTAVERGCGRRGYPQKYSTALLQVVEKFSLFPRRVRRQGRGERQSIYVIWFLFVLYSSLSTVISWFSTKFIHSCGYSCG